MEVNIESITDNTRNRFEKEKEALLSNQAGARAMLKQAALASVCKIVDMAPTPKYTYLRDGTPVETPESQYIREAWAELEAESMQSGQPRRPPTKWDIMMRCQINIGMASAAHFVNVRDTIGLKPVDESKQEMVITTEYDSLTDEELKLLKEHREKKGE